MIDRPSKGAGKTVRMLPGQSKTLQTDFFEVDKDNVFAILRYAGAPAADPKSKQTSGDILKEFQLAVRALVYSCESVVSLSFRSPFSTLDLQAEMYPPIVSLIWILMLFVFFMDHSKHVDYSLFLFRLATV